MKQYLDTLKYILENGVEKGDRTGTGTISVFGYQARYDLSEGFPLVTTKKVSFKNIVSELLWFIRGDTNIRFLLQHNNHIWDEWAFKNWVESPEYNGPDMTDFGRRCQVDPEFNELYQIEMKKFVDRILNDDEFANKYGDLGPVYGKQWRKWNNTLDQLSDVIKDIKKNPNSRRLIVSAWNPVEVKDMALPPCHTLFQFYVVNNKLSCQLYQRSCDAFLGLPYNIASYALLTHMVAQVCDLDVGEFILSNGDLHIYSNHIEQVKLQLSREPYPLPKLKLNPDIKNIDEFTIDDIKLENYISHPAIKAPVAV